MSGLDSLLSEIKEQESATDFYKIKEGANKLRILTDFTKVETVWEGQKYKGHKAEGYQPQGDEKVRVQGWAWAIIRETGEIQIVQFSKTILSHLGALKNDPDYAFSDFPMPYDITVSARGAGTKEVEYQTTAARQNTPVTEAELAGLNKKPTIRDIIKAITNKQSGEKKEEPASPTAYPEGSETGDIPF